VKKNADPPNADRKSLLGSTQEACYNPHMKTESGFIKVDGGKIWYKKVGLLKGTPLVVLHGGPGFPHYPLLPLETLSNDRQVIFYDQLGCGKSDRPKNKALWKKERFLKELQILVQELKLKDHYILGQSWGSMLATEYALTFPAGLKKIVLSGPFLSTTKWIQDANKLKAQLPKKTLDILEKNEMAQTTDTKEYKKAEKEYNNKHLCRINPLPQSMVQCRKEGNVDIYNTMWGPSEFHCTGNLKNADLTKDLHKIKIPVLLTCGKFDEATPETTKFYTSLFPNARMTIFNKSSHSPHLEETDLYLKTIRKFLNSQIDSK
jgi:proline iminopeptidase